MRVLPVNAQEGLAEFIGFPWTIYGEDPLWIPPLREQILYELTASAFARYGRMQLFLCEADGRIAGRIAAIVNPRLVDGDGVVLGQLGYFECVDDSSIATSLIEAGFDWLKAQGVRQVLGPMNGGVHKMHRFLTRGFNEAPFLWEPRNPPYYARLFELCGFATTHRWFSYELNRDEATEQLRQWERVLTRKPAPSRVEELPAGQPELTMPRIHQLLDTCWAGHVAYTPLEMHEFQEIFRGPLSIMRTGHVSVTVQNNVDLGFSLMYPDYAAEVRALGGHAAGWGTWLGEPLPKQVVLHTLAIYPEVRKTSSALAQLAGMFRRSLADGFDELILALAVEGFVSRVGKQTREYALYSRAL